MKAVASVNKQQNYHRSRATNVNTHSKEPLKKSEPVKPRAVSLSRTDSTRLSIRVPKSAHVSVYKILTERFLHYI